jgi:hypothetical protein
MRVRPSNSDHQIGQGLTFHAQLAMLVRLKDLRQGTAEE